MPQLEVRDYDNAVTLWKQFILIQDDDLRNGNPQTYFEPARNGRGPTSKVLRYPGNFAVVYKLVTATNKKKAIRGFLTPIGSEVKTRYQKIAKYFTDVAPGFVVHYEFFENGISLPVKDINTGSYVKYPVPLIVMDWAEGLTLQKKVWDQCQSGNTQALQNLSNKWLELVDDMHKLHIGHGDLSGSNVIVNEADDKLLLIDYDDIYVPSLDDRTREVGGQLNYQHPFGLQRAYGPDMDAFSALSIYTSLRALAAQPALMSKYLKETDDDRLLFTVDDYQNPDQSLIFRDLDRLSDQLVREAVRELRVLCKASPRQVLFPTKLLRPNYSKLLETLKQALALFDDELIVKSWTPELASYAPAQQYAPQIALARKCIEDLKELRQALQSGNEKTIVELYTPELRAHNNLRLTRNERKKLLDAEKLVSAFQRLMNVLKAAHDERNIVAAYDPDLEYCQFMTDDLRNIVRQARLCVDMPQKIRAAIKAKKLDRICDNYDPTLVRPFTNFTIEEQAEIDRAIRRNNALQVFLLAIDTEDELIILRAYIPILHSHPKITQAHRQKLTWAHTRKQALDNIKAVLSTTSDEHEIASAYKPVLEGSPNLSNDEWRLIRNALACFDLERKLNDAINSDNDEQILLISNPLNHRLSTTLTAQQLTRIQVARERIEAVKQLHRAIQAGDDYLITAVADRYKQNSLSISPDEELIVATAASRLTAYNELSRALETNDNEIITLTYNQILNGSQLLSVSQRNRVDLANRNVIIEEKLLDALKKRDFSEIHNILQKWPDAVWKINATYRSMVQEVIDAHADLEHFRAVSAQGDISNMLDAYTPTLIENPNITLAEDALLKQIRSALISALTIVSSLQAEDYERAISANRADLERFLKVLLSDECREKLTKAETYEIYRRSAINALGNREFQKAFAIADQWPTIARDPRMAIARQKYTKVQ